MTKIQPHARKGGYGQEQENLTTHTSKYGQVREGARYTSTRHTKGHEFEVGQVASGGSNFSGDCSGDAEPEHKHSDAGCSRYSEPVNAIQNKKAIMT